MLAWQKRSFLFLNLNENNSYLDYYAFEDDLQALFKKWEIYFVMF
jgi:hypothetical protein